MPARKLGTHATGLLGWLVWALLFVSCTPGAPPSFEYETADGVVITGAENSEITFELVQPVDTSVQELEEDEQVEIRVRVSTTGEPERPLATPQ